MKIDIPTSVASSQDISDIILEIHDYAKWFNHESIKAKTNARHKSDPPTLTPITQEILQKWQVKKPINSQSLDDLIDELNDVISSSPSITITLAAPVTSTIKSNLVGWCRNNISADVLVNFQFNSTILGGMVVRYGSRIFDWSFRRRLLTNKDDFPETLRHV